jgi:hypothetical protein
MFSKLKVEKQYHGVMIVTEYLIWEHLPVN